jgi:hypothetical protein
VTTIADENGFCLGFVWIAVGLRLPSTVLLGALYENSDLPLPWTDLHFVSPLYIFIYLYIPISPKTAVSIPVLIETALLYAHWQEQSANGETEYYMERVMQIFLGEEHRVADMRSVMNHRTSQEQSLKSRGGSWGSATSSSTGSIKYRRQAWTNTRQSVDVWRRVTNTAKAEASC